MSGFTSSIVAMGGSVRLKERRLITWDRSIRSLRFDPKEYDCGRILLERSQKPRTLH